MERTTRSYAAPLGLGMAPPTDSVACMPLKHDSIPDNVSLGDDGSDHARSEHSANSSSGEGHAGGHLERATRSFAAPLGLGVTPPTGSTAYVPPRPSIAPDTVILAGDEADREGSVNGANGANCERREDSYSRYAKQPITALPSLGVMTPARPSICEHMRPATAPKTKSLRGTRARRVGSEVGDGNAHEVRPESESFSCTKRLGALLEHLQTGAPSTEGRWASSGAAPSRATPASGGGSAGSPSPLRGAALPSTQKTLETSEPIGEPDGEEGCDQKGYQRSRVVTRRARDAKARGRHRARLLSCPSDIEVPPQVSRPVHGNAATSLSSPADHQAASATAPARLVRATRLQLACVACDTPEQVPQGRGMPQEHTQHPPSLSTGEIPVMW